MKPYLIITAFLMSLAKAGFDPYPGVLLNVTFRGTVGVLMPGDDETNLSNQTRNAFFTSITRPPKGFWVGRVKSQIRYTLHKQVYRRAYVGDWSKGQLVLPPESVWRIQIDPDNNGVRVISRNTKKFVAVQYVFSGIVIARRGSVYRAEVRP